MNEIFVFTKGPPSWQKLLAKPDLHWKVGRSARTLAHCWEAADGFPPEVFAAFESANHPLLAKTEPLIAIPECKVSLPGEARASQNDIFVLSRSRKGPVAIMVEGKVTETFDDTVEVWRSKATKAEVSGKEERLAYLRRELGLSGEMPGNIRYQLLHRAVSAIIVGEQYRAAAAVLLVHSFCPKQSGWGDFQAFARLFGVEAEVNVLRLLGSACRVPLFAVWVTGNQEFLRA
ncbi:hypothetical protein [Accumulibacter sp.]|uniref:DUF6946 family protein n=1 Tax=Accumulibacter sp. TaxID=2053492 RepID=UPI0025E5F8F4|nr:hypothetical protein [Accumulibacter sp.]MCM8611829.1 hypothetical protein [Accumulibacter sp.]MCM8635451.1 hypothetical protein [Accumulibacter sp.]MCM8639029.1 hypothetical protein [Accumulibacter sp.]